MLRGISWGPAGAASYDRRGEASTAEGKLPGSLFLLALASTNIRLQHDGFSLITSTQLIFADPMYNWLVHKYEVLRWANICSFAHCPSRPSPPLCTARGGYVVRRPAISAHSAASRGVLTRQPSNQPPQKISDRSALGAGNLPVFILLAHVLRASPR